jgi:ankyrin repeat protein
MSVHTGHAFMTQEGEHDLEVYGLSENRREEWLRLQAEKIQARKVIGKSGLALNRSLYFGTRRSTHSDVVSMITTVVPYRDKGFGPTWERIEDSKVRLEPFKNAKYTSPLYDPMQLDVDEHLRKNKALWKEHVKFMRKLNAQRGDRGAMEAHGAVQMQRIWRGFRLRRWLKANAKRMKVQRRMKKSYLKIAMKIHFKKELEEHGRRVEERREDAADKIVATFRMYLARNCAMKERKMRLDEVRRWAATTIQTLARQRVARRALEKKWHRRGEEQVRNAVVLIQKNFRRNRDRRVVQSKRVELQRVAAIWVQRWYRGVLAAKVLRKAKVRVRESVRVDAALVIQNFWRGIQARREVYLRRHKEEAEMLEAATLFIQRSFRGHIGRRLVNEKRAQFAYERRLIASIQIQRVARGHLGRVEFEDEVDRQDTDIWRKIKDGNITAVEDLYKGFGTDVIYNSDSTDPDGNTILCAAARWGHKRIVRRALKWHCEMNHYNDDGLTAVELAVLHGHESVAEYLIEKDCELTFFGRTLLHETAQRKMHNVATAILQRGCPVNVIDAEKITPLHEAAGSGAWNLARLLIDRGASIDATTEKLRQTPLHIAAEKGHLRMISLLMEAGARIDLKDAEGRTPWRTSLAFNQKACAALLRKAHRGQVDMETTELEADNHSLSEDDKDEVLSLARRGDLAGVTEKLEGGCPVNIQGSGGESLLMASASGGNTKLIELLIRKGVSLKTLDFQNRNCLFFATDNYDVGIMLAGRGADLLHKDSTGTTALHACARDGTVFTDIIKSLRLNVNVKDGNGRLPIHSASVGGHGDAIRALIGLGADVNAQDTDGATPMHLAAEAEDGMKSINALCESGKAKLNCEDNEGRTPLHRAANSGFVANIISLCEVTGGHLVLAQKDQDGNTPLHLAAINGSLQAVRAMVTKGSNVEELNNNGLDVFGACLKSGNRALSVVQFMLQKEMGSLKTRYGAAERTPLHIAAEGGSEMIVQELIKHLGDKRKAISKFLDTEDKDGETAYMIGCKLGHVNVVKCLSAMKCKVHANVVVDQKTLRTCLHIASCVPNVDEPNLIRILVHDGYDLGKPEGSGQSCIHLAAEAGHADIVETMIQLGVAADIKDGKGKSAMHISAENGRLRVCKVLHKNGARVDVVDNKGETALDLAEANAQKAVVAWLKESATL